jgi:hypothetical protein
MQEGHAHLFEIHQDSLIGGISDVVGLTQMPSPNIWNPVFAALSEADHALDANHSDQANQSVQSAVRSFTEAVNSYNAYRRQNEQGTENATSVLRVVQGLGMAAAGILVGIEFGAGMVAMGAGQTLSAAGAAGLGTFYSQATIHTIGAASAELHGVNNESPQQILAQAFAAGASAVVMSFMGGALSGLLARAIVNRGAVQVGASEARLLLSNSERIFSEVLVGIGLAPLQTVINRRIRAASGVPSPESFARELAEELVVGALSAIFLGELVRRTQRTHMNRAGDGNANLQVAERGNLALPQGQQQRAIHIHQVERYQRTVVGRVPGVPAGLEVVPDWHPGPLSPNQARLSALQQFLRMVATTRGQGEVDFPRWYRRMVEQRTMTMRPGSGSFANETEVNIDPAQSANAGRGFALRHEGHHVEEMRLRGGMLNPQGMSLERFLNTMFEEEAEAQGRALRDRMRAERQAGRSEFGTREAGADIYYDEIVIARARGYSEQVGHMSGVDALVRAWGNMRTSGPRNPTYREHYTRAWQAANPGRTR